MCDTRKKIVFIVIPFFKLISHFIEGSVKLGIYHITFGIRSYTFGIVAVAESLHGIKKFLYADVAANGL